MDSKKRYYQFCFTVIPYTEDDYTLVLSWDCAYLIVGREVCPTTQLPHLQCFIAFKNAKTFSAFKKMHPKMHFSPTKGTPEQNRTYCSKDGNFFEKGELPMSQKEKGNSEVVAWQEALLAVQEGRLEDVRPDILCRNLKSVEYAAERIAGLKRKVETLDEMPKCVWIWGPSRTGKSHHVDVTYPDRYIKDVNTKRWDGYQDQDVVELQDVDLQYAAYGGDLKRLADKYPIQIQEIYKPTRLIRPKAIFVTSNFHPCEIWRDSKMLDPIMERFELVHKTTVYVKPTEEARAEPRSGGASINGSDAPPAASCEGSECERSEHPTPHPTPQGDSLDFSHLVDPPGWLPSMGDPYGGY